MKILVISSNLIGDSILSTGIIKYFIDLYSKSKITVVIGPAAAQIYENFPNIEKIIIIKKKKYNLHWLAIWKKCFTIKWDLIIDFRSSAISYLLLNNKRFIYKRRSNNKLQIKQLNDFFKLKTIASPIIFNSISERNIVKEKIFPDKKYLVIAPGGNWIPKIWPSKNFNKLIKKLSNKYQEDLFIILVGSHIEKQKYKKEVIGNLNSNKIIDIMGATLTQTYAFMKKSSLFIGNDSGLMHLAAASNISTIGLFGPTNDKLYAPFGSNCYIIRTEETYEDFQLLNIKNDECYMQNLDLEKIVDLIEKKSLI